jgi:hypothetical protein
MKYHPDIEKAKYQYENTHIDPIVVGQSIISRVEVDRFQTSHGGEGGVDLWLEIQGILGLRSG